MNALKPIAWTIVLCVTVGTLAGCSKREEELPAAPVTEANE